MKRRIVIMFVLFAAELIILFLALLLISMLALIGLFGGSPVLVSASTVLLISLFNIMIFFRVKRNYEIKIYFEPIIALLMWSAIGYLYELFHATSGWLDLHIGLFMYQHLLSSVVIYSLFSLSFFSHSLFRNQKNA